MRVKGAKYAVWLASGSFFKSEITSSFTFANFARFKQLGFPIYRKRAMSSSTTVYDVPSYMASASDLDTPSYDYRASHQLDYDHDNQRVFNVAEGCTNGASYPELSGGSGARHGAMDRFPDALVADFHLFNRPCCGDSSDDGLDRGCLPPPSLPGGDHPIYNPKKDKCMWCKQRGHSLLFCRERLEHCERMRELNCCKGYHMPHLHDDLEIWRCQWCGTHLKASYVRYNYPNTYAFEREKCLGNIDRSRRKYGN